MSINLSHESAWVGGRFGREWAMLSLFHTPLSVTNVLFLGCGGTNVLFTVKVIVAVPVEPLVAILLGWQSFRPPALEKLSWKNFVKAASLVWLWKFCDIC